MAKTIFYSLAALVRKTLFCHLKKKFISLRHSCNILYLYSNWIGQQQNKMFYITGLLAILFRWIEVMTRNMSAFTRANGIKDNIINVLSQTLYTLLFHITTFLYQFNYTMQTCKEAKSYKINLSVIKMLTSHSTYYSNNIWVIQFHHNFSFMHNFSLKRK